jgi:transcriptional regulator with XRE-family HTH domain
MNTATTPSIGELLRTWRQRRRMSQLDLANEAEISSRHLSFLETGRSLPSREMLLHLAEQLAIPARERNILLVPAGYAPMFPERRLDDPALHAARNAVDLLLAGHAPNPALAIDRHWNLVASNSSVAPLLAGVDPGLLQPPVNVLRLSLHPAGLAPRIANLPEWRAHLLARLRHQIELSADPTLADLLQELSAYRVPNRTRPGRPPSDSDTGGVIVPFQLIVDGAILSFYSTTTVFGTPIDITVSELAIETFFPADAQTAEAIRTMAGGL